MNSTKRLFLAIKLSQELVFRVQDLKNDAESLLEDRSLRWTASDNLHLTLLFLGDTDVSEIPTICKVMDESVKNLKSFEMTFTGLGCFPNTQKPRVFWMGVEDPQPLRLLYNRLIRGLSPVIKLNRPKFSPHVTLVRLKDYAKPELIMKLNQLIDSHQERRFGSMRVEQATLFESDLQPSGPIYKTIHHSMLK